MFLKVRDEKDNKWWYIHNIDRLVVSDPMAIGEEVEAPMADLRLIRPSDGYYQSINCIRDRHEDVAQKEYLVVFDTEAYLCTDNGETTEIFRPNR